MRAFDYEEPRTLAEAMAALRKPGTTRLLAGGTDLLVRLKRREWPAERVVNLKRIAGLGGIEAKAGRVRIGALATVEDVARSGLLAERHPVLCEAALEMASPQVRVLATAGGNLCNASPAADLAPPLLALEAEAEIASPRGIRVLPLREFFKGPGRTALAADEILIAIVVPAGPSRGTFVKFCQRRAMDLAIVSVACVRVGSTVRVALGAVAPTPILVPPSPDEAYRRCSPIDDHRASAEYRREMARVLTRRALEKIA